MFYVYLLKSEKDKKFYIGYSGNLKRRIQEHLAGLVVATKHRHPLKLVYYEAYADKLLAQQRECQLKSFGSAYRGLLKRMELN